MASTAHTFAKETNLNISFNNNNNNNSSSNSNATSTTTASSNSNNIPLISMPLYSKAATHMHPTTLALFQNANINNMNSNANIMSDQMADLTKGLGSLETKNLQTDVTIAYR